MWVGGCFVTFSAVPGFPTPNSTKMEQRNVSSARANLNEKARPPPAGPCAQEKTPWLVGALLCYPPGAGRHRADGPPFDALAVTRLVPIGTQRADAALAEGIGRLCREKARRNEKRAFAALECRRVGSMGVTRTDVAGRDGGPP